MSDKDKENPFEELQKQVQDMFGKANLSFVNMPGMEEAPEDGDDESEGEAHDEVLERIRGFDLKPREIKDYLDRYVIKQSEAKKVISVAICDHYNHVRRCLEAPELREEEYAKQNIILLGPTGVGKTYIMRTLAKLIGVPFVKADATKFSETGYVGNDVDDIVRDLVKAADGDLELAQYGIIYIDEVDKIASESTANTKDVSGRGVQINLLKLMEETEVNLTSQTDMIGQMHAIMEMQRTGATRKSSISTRHMLFIVSGAFGPMVELIRKRLSTSNIGFGSGDGSEPVDESEYLQEAETRDFINFGFEPEFIGRLPVRVALQNLTRDDLEQILVCSEGSILKQYTSDFTGYDIHAHFTPDACRAVAELAEAEKTGARGLMTVLERAVRDFKFELPSTVIRELEITGETIRDPGSTLADLLANQSDAQRAFLCGEIAEFVERFEQDHRLRLEFEPDAVEALIDLSLETNKTIRGLCEEKFKDYQYGLKLVGQNTGTPGRFVLRKEAVEDPDQELSRMVLESYQQKAAPEEPGDVV